MGTIDDLKSTLDGNGGPASPTRYDVYIAFPLVMAPAYFATRTISLTAELTELPGRQIATTPQTMYGVTRKMPYGVIYNPLPMTFICTNNMLIRSIFDTWHSRITNPTNNYFNYYDDYTGYILLIKKDERDNIRYPIWLDEVFPMEIEPQPLNASATDEYFKLTINFAYRRWRTAVDLGSDVIFGGGAFNLGPFGIDPGNLALPPSLGETLVPATPNSPFNDLLNDIKDGGNKILNNITDFKIS